ncbi:MAG: hypothetical protein WC222_01000 [Parachlamydiales bacterium]|jgi:hypothetical protein
MATKTKDQTKELTLVDAIETLSSIAELGADKKTGVVEEQQLKIKEKKISYHSVRWLHHSDGESTLAVIKDIFRVILQYLIGFYEKGYNEVNDKQTAEEIRTIMVLVGEAAKNLDKYGNLFTLSHQPISVMELQEYQQLQAYYLTKVAPKIDDGHMGKWILALSKGPLAAKAHLKLKHSANDTTKHVFVDLHSVKRDSEYELFFIRKEDGSRFFNPRLIRNLKLVSDLGHFFRSQEKRHTLPRLDIWLDKYIQATAASMINSLKNKLDMFFREAVRNKGKPLVEDLTKTSMALLLSASPKHLLSEHPSKSCLAYFKDFQRFLREILHSKEYQKLLVSSTIGNNKIGGLIRETTLGLCRGLYIHAKGLSILQTLTNDLIHKGKKGSKSQDRLVELMESYEELQHLIQVHAHGPLNKMLDMLLDGENDEFDPMGQLNLPSPLYAAYFNDKRLLYIRMPSPTHQEYVHKAFVNEEFKNYLTSCETGSGIKKHLLIVLQDKTTWKEAARCQAIEGLLHHKDFSNHLEVCTFTYDTDLYRQTDHYQDENEAESFKKILLEHMKDDHSGFFFPPHLQRPLYSEFLPQCIEAVHSLFFEKATLLTREERHAFIDLTYVLTTLKIVELSQADALSFCCKDGIDTGAAFSGLLFALFQWVSPNYKDVKGDDFLTYLLFAPSLLWRERALRPEQFYRLMNVLKVLENSIQKKGHANLQHQLRQEFSGIFSLPLWNAEVSWT